MHHVGANEAEITMNVPSLINYARRRLLGESSNLAAEPYSGGPITDFSYDPIIISSGSIPAVPDVDKKQNQSHSPLPSPSDSAFDGNQTNQQHSANGGSGKLWKYIIIIIVVAVLLIVVVVLSIWRKRAAKIIKPWKTGISGQLQRAFITGTSFSK